MLNGTHLLYKVLQSNGIVHKAWIRLPDSSKLQLKNRLRLQIVKDIKFFTRCNQDAVDIKVFWNNKLYFRRTL